MKKKDYFAAHLLIRALVNFYDPNSELTQEVNDAFCKVSWDWDGTSTVQGPGNNYPDGFTICSVALYNSFQVQINAFLSASKFQGAMDPAQLVYAGDHSREAP